MFERDSRRSAYLGATSLTEATVLKAQRVQECEWIFCATITGTDPAHIIRVADRNWTADVDFMSISAGDVFDGVAKIPTIEQSMIEPLVPQIQFSEVEIEINNINDAYSKYLTGGASYDPFVGGEMRVYMVIPSVGAYLLFAGYVHYEGALTRKNRNVTVRARHLLEKYLSDNSGHLKFYKSKWVGPTSIGDAVIDDNEGKLIPYIIDDFNSTAHNFSSIHVIGPYYIIADTRCLRYGNKPYIYLKRKGSTDEEVVTYTVDAFTEYAYYTGAWVIKVTNIYSLGAYTYTSGDEIIFGNTGPTGDPFDTDTSGGVVNSTEQYLRDIAGFTDELFYGINLPSEYTSSLTESPRVEVSHGNKSTHGDIVAQIAEHGIYDIAMYIDQTDATYPAKLQPVLRPIYSTYNSRTLNVITQDMVVESSVKTELDKNFFFNRANGTYDLDGPNGKTLQTTRTRKNMKTTSSVTPVVYKTVDLPMAKNETQARFIVDRLVRTQSALLEYFEVKCMWSMLFRNLGEYVALDFKISGVCERGNAIGQIRGKTIDSRTGFVTLKILSLKNFSLSGYNSATNSSDLSEFNAIIQDE